MTCVGQNLEECLTNFLSNIVLMNRRLTTKSFKGSTNFLYAVKTAGNELIRYRSRLEALSKFYSPHLYWELVWKNSESYDLNERLRRGSIHSSEIFNENIESIYSDNDFPEEDSYGSGFLKVLPSRTLSFNELFPITRRNSSENDDFQSLAILEKFVGELIHLKDFKLDLPHDIAEPAITTKEQITMDSTSIGLLNTNIPSDTLKIMYSDFGEEYKEQLPVLNRSAETRVPRGLTPKEYVKYMERIVRRQMTAENPHIPEESYESEPILSQENDDEDFDHVLQVYQNVTHRPFGIVRPTFEDFMTKKFTILDPRYSIVDGVPVLNAKVAVQDDLEDSNDEIISELVKAPPMSTATQPQPLSLITPEDLRLQWRKMIRVNYGEKQKTLRQMLENPNQTIDEEVYDLEVEEQDEHQMATRDQAVEGVLKGWFGEEENDVFQELESKRRTSGIKPGIFVKAAVQDWYLEVKRAK
ncbi:hypothetical protein HK096_008966, partial [Nowakowskiella sp. JEL0078]